MQRDDVRLRVLVVEHRDAVDEVGLAHRAIVTLAACVEGS
jgi:hypothetical protein